MISLSLFLLIYEAAPVKNEISLLYDPGDVADWFFMELLITSSAYESVNPRLKKTRHPIKKFL